MPLIRWWRRRRARWRQLVREERALHDPGCPADGVWLSVCRCPRWLASRDGDWATRVTAGMSAQDLAHIQSGKAF